MSNDDLYQKAIDAIVQLFGDMSVSKLECKNNLKTLIEEIETMLETLEE
jgi:hypothetical protein